MKQSSHPNSKYRCLIVLLILLNCTAHSQIITTVAGNGIGTYNGDSIPALQAQFLPTAIATDSLGNLYISDLDDSRVRKVNVNGIITTVAGNGIRNFSGDGGLAVNASLNYNWGITLDSALNLYIVDNGESRIRKVTAANGIINTIAGIDDFTSGGYNGDSILAINARFDHPSYVTLDSIGYVYISDQGMRIRKIDTNGIITTIAGTGVIGYTGDGGLAVNAQIGDPMSIVVDKKGNIYFSDVSNHIIRKIDKNGIISTVAGSGVMGYTGDGGPAISATFNTPYGLAVSDNGTLFIADFYNHAVRKVDTTGIITTVVGNGSPGFSGDGGLAQDAKLNLPAGVAFDNENNLLIADYGNARIRKVTSAILPNTLTGFNAFLNDDKVKINWQTTNELNAAYYDVQQSTDGHTYTTIGKVDAAGNSSKTHNYQFTDEQAMNLESSTLYYRLQSVDKNGSSTYSKTVTVKISFTRLLTLYPNPAIDILKIRVNSSKKEAATIQITDLAGKVVKQLNVALAVGLNSFSLKVGSLAKGSYVVTVKGATKDLHKQFIKL